MTSQGFVIDDSYEGLFMGLRGAHGDSAKVERGGPGSGHFDHAGRPGEQGGSLPSNVRVEKLGGETIAVANPDGTISVDPDNFFGHSKADQEDILAHERAHFLEARIPPEVKATLFDDGVVSAYRGKNVNEKLANMIQDGTLPAYLQAYIDRPEDFHSGEGKDSLKYRIARSLELHNSPEEFLDTIEGAAWLDAIGHIHKTPAHSEFLIYLESEYDLPDLPMYEDRYRRAMTDMGLIRMYRDETGVGAVFYTAADVTPEQIDTLTVLAGGLRARGEGLGLFSDLPGLGPEPQAARIAEAKKVERRIGESEEIVVERAAPDANRPPKRERKKTSDWRTGRDLTDDMVDRAHAYLSIDLPEQFLVTDVETPTDWKPEISNPLDGDRERLLRWLGYNIRAYHMPEGWDMRDAGERAGVVNRIPTPIMRERIEFLDGMGSALERATLGPEMVALSEAVTAVFGGEPIPRWAMVQGDPDETIEVLAKGKTISGVIGQMALTDWTALDDNGKRRLLGEFYMEDAGLETGGMVTMLPDIVRVLYYDTQDILKAQGFERDSTLRLYRGLIETPDMLLPAEMDGGWVNVEISNLSPWTFSPGVAAEYATEQVGRGSILAMDVPVSMIFCNWETGPASRRWLSYLLMASRDPMKAYLYPVQRARLRNG
jgi:hypothetical protein